MHKKWYMLLNFKSETLFNITLNIQPNNFQDFGDTLKFGKVQVLQVVQ